MNNKKAKLLMLGCIGSRNNGECFILDKVSIKTSDLEHGPIASLSVYIGVLDEPETLSNVSDFCQKLNLPKRLITDSNY